MKKILIILSLMFLFSSNAYAGLIAIETLSSDNDFTFSRWNNSFNTVKNEFNGSVESVNIANDTLAEADMADEINPRVRWGELFNDITDTGHLPATATGLTSDISAGTSYVEGYRVVTAATSKTYTASKDTWVYIDINGTFQYEEVALGASQPTTPANSLLLATVTTDASDITTVTDRRTTSLSVGAQEDQYLSGYILSMNSPDQTQVVVNPGVTYVGTTRIEKTTATTLDMDTSGDWHDGAADDYTGSPGFCFIGVDSSGNIKLLGKNSPDISDTSENSAGILRYWDDGTTHWRVLGQVAVDTSDNILRWFQQGNLIFYDEPQNVTTSTSTSAWSAAVDCSNFIPSTSEFGFFGLMNHQADSGGSIKIRPNGTAWALNSANGLMASDYGASHSVAGQRTCMTDSSQQIQHYDEASSSATRIDVEGYIFDLRD